MSSHEVKQDRKYTKDHEWAKDAGDDVLIGVSAYAVDQLGDITLVNIDLAEGEEIEVGKPFGTVESVKTLADLFAPFSGKLTRINTELEDAPELVNDDCYDKGWLVAIAPSDKAQLDDMMDAGAYAAFLESEG